MGDFLGPFAGQLPEGLDGPPKHPTLNENLIRKKSVFTLAAEIFKPNRIENLEIPSLEQKKQERVRGPWNSFVSLRGLRDSGRKGAVDVGTGRCRSSSPRKENDLGIDDFSTKKVMRRKSLQDLLGTVSSKLSLKRRPVYSEDSIPQSDPVLRAMAEFPKISPLILPEPVVPLLGPPDAGLSSLCIHSKVSDSNEAFNSHGKHAINRDSEETPSVTSKLRAKPSLRILKVAGQPHNDVFGSGRPDIPRRSQELKKISPSPSPERLYPVVPTDYLRDVSPQVPTHVRFVDEKDAPQHRCSDGLEDANAPENANLDPSFAERALRREARYKSIYDAPIPERMELLITHIEKHVALTAAKVSKNLHISDSQSRWSVDSSETDADSMSDYRWVEKEMEVRDIIDRGKEIMSLGTLSPYLHSSILGQVHTSERSTDSAMDETVNILAPNEEIPNETSSPIRSGTSLSYDGSQLSVRECPISNQNWMSSASSAMRPVASKVLQPGLPISGDLATSDDRLQETDEFVAQKTSSTKVNRVSGRLISLENGDRFRPRYAHSRIISGEPVHIVYPPNEFNAAYTKTYVSKISAFGDLYQNHGGFSDYCLFDRSTRTYYPQALSDPIPESLQSNDKDLEVLWLPLEIFPAEPLIGQAKKEDGNSFCRKVGVPNLISGPLPTSTLKKSETKALNIVENTAPSSYCHDRPDAEHDVWACSTDSARHVDMFGTRYPNHTTALICSPEASCSAAGILISEGPEPDLEDMDDSYEIAVDSATARLYLGSLFSSTESLHSKSADSILHRLKGAQPEEAKHVETWIEMEREFLDKFAPSSQMFPDQRRRAAVYEAFKKLKVLADSSNEKDVINSDDPKSDFQDVTDIEQEKWLRYREAYMGFSFEPVEDLAKCAGTRSEPLIAASSSRVKDSSNQSLSVDHSTIFDAKNRRKETAGLPQCPHIHSEVVATLRNHCGETAGVHLELSSTELMSKKTFEGDEAQACLDSNIASLGCHSRLGSETYSNTDSTGITMLSGYMFTHYAEQLGECPAEPYREEQCNCEDECDDNLSLFPDRPTNVASNLSASEKAILPPWIEPRKTDARVWSDEGQISDLPKTENVGLARAMTVQVCPPPTRVGLAPQPPGRSTSLNTGGYTHTEALSGLPPPNPFLTIWKRVSTPSTGNPSPLAEFSSHSNQTIRGTSPSPSDADTEVSENFGQKLKTYNRTEEEDKENDLWWTDSISYG